jgi:regulatory protein
LDGCVSMENKVTALKVQKRNPNRVNVYLDGDFAFGLSRIVAAWLHIGQVLDDQKIEELKAKDNGEVAYQKALLFIGHRPRSEAEVVKRLEKHGFEDEVIEAIMTRLRSQNLVGDLEFARLWVDNRSTFRPRGRRALSVELKQKGVSELDIQEALEGMQDEEVLAYRVAMKHAPRLKELEWFQFRQRLGARLARRGFNYDAIQPVVERVWAELQDENSLEYPEDHHNKEAENESN